MTIYRFPSTQGRKWKKRMVEELRYFADMIESDGFEEEVTGFVTCIFQGDQYHFGGVGEMTLSQQRKMKTEFIKFMAELRRS